MPQRDDETHAEKLLQRKDAVEAMSWLKGQSANSMRALAELPNSESQQVIQRIYDQGARNVWACDFVRNPPYEAIVWLVVELPEARWKREDVQAYLTELSQAQGFDEPLVDTRQRFQAMWFD